MSETATTSKLSETTLAQILYLKKLGQDSGRQSIGLREFLRQEIFPEKITETLYEALFGFDFSSFDKHDFARRYSNCAGKPGAQNARGVLAEICASKGAFGCVPTTPEEWKKALNNARQTARRFRPSIVCERRKPKDAELQNSWAALWKVLGPMITIAQRFGPNEKSKENFKKTSYRKSLVIHILRRPELRDKCASAWACASQKEIAFPSIDQILIKLKDHYGAANTYLEMRQHVREMVPQKVERYAQLWSLDCTGLDVEVGNGWQQKSNGRQQRFCYSRVDCYSGEIHAVALEVGNEHAGWDEASNRHCDSSDVAPEEILTDKGGKLVSGFAELEPGMTYEEITKFVSRGILTWVAAGSKPSFHLPKRPQGKAFCERGLGLHKNDFHAMIDARAMALKMEGKLPSNRRGRFFPSETEFQKFFSETLEFRNAECKNFRETERSRSELAEESKTAIELCRMVPQARLNLIARKREVRVLSAHGAELYDANGAHRATLSTPLSVEDASAADGIILILPALRLGDAEDAVRCLAIRNRAGKGLPHFTLYEGARAGRNTAGFPSNAESRGIFRMRPETESEKKLSTRESELKEFVAQLPAPQVAAAAAAPKKKAVHVSGGEASGPPETAEQIFNRKYA